jgi:4-coumarate--CoA ligase
MVARSIVYPSPLPDVVVPDTALTPFVLEHAARFGDKPALVDGVTGRTLSYSELDLAVRRFAAGVAASGLPTGSVIGLMAPNRPEFAVVFLGAAMAGHVITTINPTYTEREAREQLADSGARMLITTVELVSTGRAAAAGTAVTELLCLGDDGADGAAADGAEADGVRPWTQLMGPPLAEQVPVDPDDTVALPYSSGTTGLSKGVMLSHRNLVANVAQTAAPAQIGDDEVLVAVLPMFHIYGLEVLMNTGLRVGATIVTLPRFDLDQFLQAHEKYRVTRSFVAPPIVVLLAKHPAVDGYDLSCLRQVFSGAAPLSAELALEAGGRLGCEVVQGYRMTETSPVSHLTPFGGFKPGSVGVTAPNTHMRIVDPASGEDLPEDQDGEIWVRGPQVMKGYFNNPSATALALDEDGWMHTGDIGHVDADGHVYVVDRLKELIKYKGFQVAPAELEGLLLSHPEVADAAVIGLPDPEAGEVPAAFVVRKPTATVSAEDLMTFVADKVARYKRLRQVTFIDAVPKSASGKILRRVLRSRVAEASPTG